MDTAEYKAKTPHFGGPYHYARLKIGDVYPRSDWGTPSRIIDLCTDQVFAAMVSSGRHVFGVEAIVPQLEDATCQPWRAIKITLRLSSTSFNVNPVFNRDRDLYRCSS